MTTPAAPAGLADVLSGACALLGVPGTSDRLSLADRLGAPRRIAVLLVDGLGYHLLPAAAPSAPLLADVLAGRAGRLDELACSFPSTTPTSLATIGTGVLPGEHGVLGFTVALPGTDRVLTHVTWRDDPDPRQWQPVPTLFDRAAAAGVRASVGPSPSCRTAARRRRAAPAGGTRRLTRRLSFSVFHSPVCGRSCALTARRTCC